MPEQPELRPVCGFPTVDVYEDMGQPEPLQPVFLVYWHGRQYGGQHFHFADALATARGLRDEPTDSHVERIVQVIAAAFLAPRRTPEWAKPAKALERVGR